MIGYGASSVPKPKISKIITGKRFYNTVSNGSRPLYPGLKDKYIEEGLRIFIFY